ncbi:hypothetical protein FMEXI_5630 [Fusarium mexicanum]|uniref:Uncharacterized protein n=1 Tax=Fusarium mexicanum TaxID=751941 RepID=A0A8H5MZG4_9HYPO|nr:hypothetical protein FMEXI_5630 [Fusarium mexicanum]
MRFSIITSSLLLAQGTCLAAPPGEGFSLLPRSKLEARDSYDCNGSGVCGSIPISDCDQAINNRLIRNNDVNYGAPGLSQKRETANRCGMTIRTSDEVVAESAAVSIGEMVA